MVSPTIKSCQHYLVGLTTTNAMICSGKKPLSGTSSLPHYQLHQRVGQEWRLNTYEPTTSVFCSRSNSTNTAFVGYDDWGSYGGCYNRSFGIGSWNFSI